MLVRIGVGAGVAALPGAAAITGAAEGWCPWVIGAFAAVAFFAIFVIPPAPYLPMLHRVPVIGSPSFRVVLRLNGQTDMRVRVNEQWSNTSILEVGIKNLERSAVVKDAWINFLLPSGLQLGRCDKVGRPKNGGIWEPFHPHRLGAHPRSDYWNDGHWVFPPQLSHVVRFKLRIQPESGEYPVVLKLGAPSIYDHVEVCGTIYVEQVADADLPLRDRMGALISEGEQLYSEYDGGVALTSNEQGVLRKAVLAYLLTTSPVLTEALGPEERLPQPPADADRGELLHRVREALDALYVLRDELGRQSDRVDAIQS